MNKLKEFWDNQDTVEKILYILMVVFLCIALPLGIATNIARKSESPMPREEKHNLMTPAQPTTNEKLDVIEESLQ